MLTDSDLLQLGKDELMEKRRELRLMLVEDTSIPWQDAKRIAEEDLRVIRALNDRFPEWNKTVRTAANGEMTIMETSKRIGISQANLRMWQTRYGWPQTVRLPSGERVYSQATVRQLVRFCALLRDGWNIRDLIKNGRIHLPDEKKGASELVELRAQIAELSTCLKRRPDEYWTTEAAQEREHALERATGGKEFLARLERLLDQNGRLLEQLAHQSGPLLAAVNQTGVMAELRSLNSAIDQCAPETIIKSALLILSQQVVERTKERNDARNEVQDLYTRQAELSRRLDEALRANRRLMSKEMPALFKRARRAEKKIEQMECMK